jgi:hypothetical protein
MANPLDPTFSPLTSGLAAPPPSMAEDYATRLRQAGLAQRQGFVQEPELPTGRTARLAYSPSTKQFFVGGYTFDDDNDTAAVALSKYANQEAPLPEGDWQEIDPASYAQYVEGIRSPGFFQQIANNFDIGLDEMQQTLGYGLMFAGATETGARLADQSADLAKTQIYQRNIENIGENGVLDWVAATIGRLGPNIIESVITAGIGAGIGSAATPAGTAGGAVLGFFGKSAVKKALYEAAKKHFKGQALDAAEKKLLLSSAGMLNAASNAAKTKLAPGAFNQFMEEGLQAGAEAVAKRVAARAPTEIGAAGLSLASNVFQQTGQAYGETMADGGEGNRAVALGVGAIGGIADTAGEFLLAGRVFSEAMGDVAGSITKRKKALNILKRVGAGAGVGAGMEGGTEAFQEALQLAANPVVDVNTAEGQSRLLNAFAGGALLGGGFGGAGGIFAGSLTDNKQEANLLLPVAKTDPGYAQYLLDVKKQLGEAEYNKVFGPPQPYTRIMEDEARTASFPTQEEFLAGRARLGVVPPSAAQPQGELFANAPMGNVPAPVPAGPMLPEAPAVGQGAFPFTPSARYPVPAVLANIPSPAEMVGPIVPSGTQASLPFAGAGQAPAPVPTGPMLPPSTDMGGTQLGLFQTYAPPAAATPQGELLLRGGAGRAPARVPTGPMPQPSADMGGVQGALQPQKEPPAPPPPTNAMQPQLERLKRGMEFEQARRQAATRATPAERVYTEATIDQPITLDVDAVISPDKLGKKLTPNERDRRKILAGFNTLTQPQQNLILGTFGYDEAQLIAYVRREKPPVVVKQFATLARVNEDAFKVDIPKPLKRGEKNAAQPGAGTEGAKPAGERAGKNRGAGEGDNVRAGAEATETQAQPAAEQPAARSETLREEAGGAAVTVESTERRLKGTPGAPPDYLVTLSDGRTAIIYKDNASKDWRIDHPGARAFAPSQVGYASDVLGATKKEALENVVDALDRMEAAVAASKAEKDEVLKRGEAGKPARKSDLQMFLDTYKDPKLMVGMRGNPDLKDVVEYADWLGSLSKKDLAKIELVFVKSDNPFLAAGSMDPVRVRAKLEEQLSPKVEGAAVAPSQEAAEEPKPVLTKAEKKAAEKAAREAKKYKNLPEKEQIALAKEAERQGTIIATAMELEQDVPTLKEMFAEVTDVEADLYEVYGTIGNIILAQRENQKKGTSVKDAAKQSFIESVGTLYNWATKPGLSQEAKNTAAAFLDVQISASETVPLKEGVKQAIKDAEQGMFSLSQFDAVTNPVDENGRPAKGVNPIRAKAIVDKFRSGLAKAPKFFVYKNQADLQRRNPDLYQRAVAARPQGDFDTAMASGYAFDGTVLVFTDRIPTEKYMRFLLAHEAIGHFGMRSLLPAKQFDALMDYVYDNNPSVRQSVDGALKGSKDLGARREAVEEHMAKFAEKLDSSILRRVWSAIKDVLNKLGVKFEDDIVRYLVSQARSTVRNGSSMFTPSTFALNLQTVMTNNGTGRFSIDPAYSAQHTLRNQLDLMATPPASIEETGNTLRDLKIDGLDMFENFMRNTFRLRNFNALRNHGAQIAEHLKDAMRTNAQSLYNMYNERLAKLLALTGDSRRVVSYAMVISRRIASPRFKLDKELRNKALLVLGDERLDGSGRDTKVDEDVLKKLLDLGTLSKKELEDGAEITYEEAIEGGKTKKVTVKVKGLQEELGRGLTDEEYDIYVQTRKDLADLDIERLKAQFDNFFLAEKVSTKGINKVLADKEMTADDGKFVRDIVNHAKKLFVDDMEYDERGMPDVTTKTAMRMEQFFKAVNTAIVKKEFTDDLKKDVREFYFPKPTKKLTKEEEQARAEALAKGNEKSEAAIKKIEDFRSRRTEFSGLEEQSVIYTVQDRVKEIVLADAAFERAQMFVRRSIASSHVPLWREGKFQVRVEAQINGRTVQLHPDVQNKMIYSLAPNLSEAEGAAAFYNDKMKDIEYSGLVRDDATGEYKTQTFKVFARASKTVDTVSSDPSIDIDNFLYVSRVLGIPLAPDKHAKAITMLTAPGSALRKSLKFDDTPGYDPSRTVEAVARHVTTRSSLIVKTRFQPLLRDLMDQSSETGQKWFGDKEAVITAKERLDAATDQKQKDYWQDRLNKELYMYVTTNPGAKGWDGSRSTFNNQPTKASLGMRYYSDTSAEFDAINDAPNISESTFEGKRFAALAKMVTSIGFLGGMFTQFAQNLMSPATNVLPYLASKDSQTGFGGGFGVAVIPAYLKAFKDTVAISSLKTLTNPLEDAKAFEKIANEIKAARDAGDTAKEAQLVQQYSLSYYEALNIAREIREGKLIPAQANSLLETARGMFMSGSGKLDKFGKGFLKFSDVYMIPFNISEQATRRATFLTAFRLEFNRLKEAGFNEDKASEMARLFAVDTVDKTLGEYSNTNRPPIWRDGVMSLLFVYKTYPLTSLLLFKNMSRAGKLGMLTSLYVLAGAAGFPLVDDIEDLIDTLSQRFGLDIGQGPAVRMAIVRQLEEFFPGWSDLILRGPMNHYTGADVGAKFGLEDFLPGTGIFLKGANTTEELKSIAGPVIGMGLSMGNFLYDFGRAPLSATVSAVDVAREAPISLVRAIGDSVAYMQNGAVVDRRGYIVSPEVSAFTVMSRILGFYPADAARQYDFIKYANRMNYDYKEVGVAYRMAWVKAMMTGDRSQAARIVREVNDWNEANQGGPGVIRNFLRNAQKALQEARRPAGERFLKSAPVASRASYDRFMGYIAPE